MMIFTKRKIDVRETEIYLNNSAVAYVHSTKFLGVYIDDKSTWNTQVHSICSKASRNIGVINRLNFLPKSILLNLYYTLIYPYLSYCIINWASTSLENLIRLKKLQKRVVRIISNVTYCAHTEPLFIQLKIMNIFDLYKFRLALFMYSCYHKLLPLSLCRYFLPNSAIHSYSTRFKDDLHMPKVRIALSQKSLHYAGPRLWNALPPALKLCRSINIFKRSYRKILMNGPADSRSLGS